MTDDASAAAAADGKNTEESAGKAAEDFGDRGPQAGAFAREALHAFDFLTRTSLEQLQQIYDVLQSFGGTEALPAKWREQLRAAVQGVLGGAAFTRMPDFASGPLRFGFMRDLQQLAGDLSTVAAEYLAVQAEYQRTMHDVHEHTMRSLQRRIEARLAGGENVASLRELYDLWVDSGEEAFGATAREDSYVRLQARLLNSAIAVRSRQQKLLEYFLAQWNLPSRSEFDALRKQVDELRQADRAGAWSGMNPS